jgi:hypothetical protein
MDKNLVTLCVVYRKNTCKLFNEKIKLNAQFHSSFFFSSFENFTLLYSSDYSNYVMDHF